MKFAALALTLLLAVGSQADPPTDSEHRFAMLRMGMDALKRSLVPLDGTEYSYVKDGVQWAFNWFDETVMSRQSEIPALIETIKETTSESLQIDFGKIRNELTPLFNQLRIREHIDQYIERLGPILTIITADYRTATAPIITKIEPQVEELRQLFRVNAMDTKEKLIPILGVIQREFASAIGKMRELFEGHVQEYKEQMAAFTQRFQSMTPEQIELKRAEMNTVGQEIIERVNRLWEIAFGVSN